MYYKEDWLMRQIETAITAIIRIITGKEEHAQHISSELFNDVMSLLKQGEICEAENILFHAIDTHEDTALETAIIFYSELNKLDDKYLESKNFSRDEIKTGLQEVCGINGLFHELFFSDLETTDSMDSHTLK